MVEKHSRKEKKRKAFQKVNSMCLERLREKERAWDIGGSHKQVLAQGRDWRGTWKVGTGQITEVLVISTSQ